MLKNGEQPLCRKARGCDIADLAGDKEVNRICNAFLEYKALDSYGHHALAQKVLRREKISDTDLIIKLEGIFTEYLNHKRKQKGVSSEYMPA